jgi:hypothetical protein
MDIPELNGGSLWENHGKIMGKSWGEFSYARKKWFSGEFEANELLGVSYHVIDT